MSAARAPWHGVLTVPPLPMYDRGGPTLEIDFDGLGEHVKWLADNGLDGITPNGSLGEYQNLSPEERARVVTTSIEAAPKGFSVIPGVAAYGAAEARRWAEQAAEAGAPAVMLLPPNSYRADRRGVIGHFRAVAEVGLPVVAYNNPFDTKVDLTPELLAELHSEGLIAAVKEFAGDVRRQYEIAEVAPGLDILCGTDDVVFEFAVAGSPGWIAAGPNVFPRASVQLWEQASSGQTAEALALYRILHPLLRWDSRTEFVQAVKLGMDMIGRYGGPCRPPRVPLNPDHEKQVRAAVEHALAAGLT